MDFYKLISLSYCWVFSLNDFVFDEHQGSCGSPGSISVVSFQVSVYYVIHVLQVGIAVDLLFDSNPL